MSITAIHSLQSCSIILQNQSLNFFQRSHVRRIALTFLFLFHLTSISSPSFAFDNNIDPSSFPSSSPNNSVNDIPRLLNGPRSSSFNFPTYCHKYTPESLRTIRQPPPLSEETLSKNVELVQIQVLIRHGARTPYMPHGCWAGYSPVWNCEAVNEVKAFRLKADGLTLETANNAGMGAEDEEMEVDVGGAGVETVNLRSMEERDTDEDVRGAGASRRRGGTKRVKEIQSQFNSKSTTSVIDTPPFIKVYDADVSNNDIPGNCRRGQILMEGIQQHIDNGRMLAESYLMDSKNNSNFIPGSNSRPFLDILQMKSEDIYLRSTDFQRTMLSGMYLFKSFVESGISYNSNSESVPPLSTEEFIIHTTNLGQEYWMENLFSSNECPAASELYSNISSSVVIPFIKAKYVQLIALIEDIFKQPIDWDQFPDSLTDCMMVSLCNPHHWKDLPPPLYALIHNKSASIKKALRTLWTEEEIHGEAIRQKKKNEWARVNHSEDELSSSQMNDIYINSFISYLEEMVQEAFGMARMHNGAEVSKITMARAVEDVKNMMKNAINNEDPKKFVLWSGHDTTLMPFLATLGEDVWDKQWPAYASMAVIELYRLPQAASSFSLRQASAEEAEGDKQSQYYFRLIMNGSDRTKFIAGCEEEGREVKDLCKAERFFDATEWTSSYQKYC